MNRLLAALLSLFVPVSCFAAQVGGEQINRVWPLTNNAGQSGLRILGTGYVFNGSSTGSLLHAEKSLTSSGTLVFEGAGSGSSLYVATSLRGLGLTDCDTAGTSKLLWDTTTGRFSCGSDTDTNTTYTPGQGLSLLSTSLKVNATLTGTLVNFQTVSGTTVFGLNSLRSSGTLVFEGAASGSSLYLGTSLNGAGLITCSNATTSKLLWNSATGRFSCGTDSDTISTFGSGNVFAIGNPRWLSKAGGTLTGALIVQNGNTHSDIASALLNVRGVGSGVTLYANKALRSSGALSWEGAGSGASLYVGTNFQGAGLADCTGTNALRWTAATGRFSCAADATGASTSFSSGQVLAIGNARYVSKAGDTMTGILVIQNGNTHSATATALLNVRGTMSGRSLNISGTGGLSLLNSNITTGRVGIGTANPKATFSVVGTSSGAYGTFTEVSPRWFQAQVYASGSALATGSGVGSFHFQIPISMSGWNLFMPQASVDKAGVTNTTTFQLRNKEKKRKIFSTVCSIDSTETGTVTGATPCTVDTTKNNVGGGENLYLDIPSVSTTAPKGLNFMFGLYKP